MCVEVLLEVLVAPLEDERQLGLVELYVKKLHDVIVVDRTQQTDLAESTLRHEISGGLERGVAPGGRPRRGWSDGSS